MKRSGGSAARNDEGYEKKRGGSRFRVGGRRGARGREVGDGRPDGGPGEVRSVRGGEGRTLSALKNFCSSHAVHLGSLGFLSPAGRWRKKKWRQKKDTFAKFADCRAPAVARGAPRERELARRSPRIDRGRRLDENEPDADPVARARATALVRLPRECGFVQNRVLNEDAKMQVDRKYRQGRRGAERAPRAISHVNSPPQRHQTPRAPSRRPSTRKRSQSPTDRARDGAASRSEPATRLPRRREPASGQPTGSFSTVASPFGEKTRPRPMESNARVHERLVEVARWRVPPRVRAMASGVARLGPTPTRK